ncbi:hypothetical protein A2376_00775 [Candidatus Woesebacteria bacterium RIFOXYB1_FULL_47_31]|uniref:Nudix hydrolase domain-containing protein n=8 Tax=Candidatus Woeseibacteriota TaxID=1752722 RepID=A0A1F8D3N2_9BACT|nr:MAG: hypothetical protein A2197_02705 [Candidatus Woesebacteria bacterium RIFOXYA1_FULL_48_16]OGM82639.1 MAG: hypothetical protein A2376_00775 [Candidatus Woesebacteria bacterium RIFOXYB1_FULL_47_31]OGM84871.1 MAG: hypothetical protein A2435_00500 [Candidatus Woesebacteria bacterium RIFOXYC1_FULL_46_16]OGM89976.1 MAG: hypothetical protein A2597_01025 [Candidatus Woesebacteria bacterium RIFOXYD1_FULL_46_19]
MNIRMVAAVVILNFQGKILIMKRSPKKKIHPNLWGLPAGGAGNSESLEKTAIREALEETGLAITNLKRGPTLTVKIPGGAHEINYFLAKSDSLEVNLNKEHSEYKWVLPAEALNYQFGIPRQHVRKVLEKFGLLQI